jgi:hypothetical protein
MTRSKSRQHQERSADFLTCENLELCVVKLVGCTRRDSETIDIDYTPYVIHCAINNLSHVHDSCISISNSGEFLPHSSSSKTKFVVLSHP